MSFKARFWASRLDLKLEGVDGGEEGEGGEGKISPMCESIGPKNTDNVNTMILRVDFTHMLLFFP